MSGSVFHYGVDTNVLRRIFRKDRSDEFSQKPTAPVPQAGFQLPAAPVEPRTTIQASMSCFVSLICEAAGQP